jgi:hypothetical protein
MADSSFNYVPTMSAVDLTLSSWNTSGLLGPGSY